MMNCFKIILKRLIFRKNDLELVYSFELDENIWWSDYCCCMEEVIKPRQAIYAKEVNKITECKKNQRNVSPVYYILPNKKDQVLKNVKGEGDPAVGKIENYRKTLKNMAEWDHYLLENSCLPGPRANLELAEAVAEEGTLEKFKYYLTFDAQKAPYGSNLEYLAVCGTNGGPLWKK